MTKPMYCPMSFNNVNHTMAGNIGLRRCIPNCAWAVANQENDYGCVFAHAAVAYLAKATEQAFYLNMRPMEDE